MAELRFVEDDAGKECTEGEGSVEELRGAKRDAKGNREDAEGEELTGAGANDFGEETWYRPYADKEHEGDKQPGLKNREHDFEEGVIAGEPGGKPVAVIAGSRECGEQNEDHHCEEVLDDQPANGDMAGVGIEEATVFERLEEDDGAGDGETEAEDDAVGERPPPEQADA